jgi:pyruvate dehydrogenase E2 component (dihydrolipoamide acetyltransferase)
MATDVLMPRLSDSMEEGTVLKWIVQPGGEVKRGEPLVEIETDKANMTYEADTDGVLIEVLAQEGETLPIGQVIARIGAAGEEIADRRSQIAEPEPAAEEPEPAAEPASEPEPEPAREREPAPAAAGDGNGRVKASPVARRMAREMGVELAALEGSGPGGRIVKADVEAAAKGGVQVQERPAETAAPAPTPQTPHPTPAVSTTAAARASPEWQATCSRAASRCSWCARTCRAGARRWPT